MRNFIIRLLGGVTRKEMENIIEYTSQNTANRISSVVMGAAKKNQRIAVRNENDVMLCKVSECGNTTYSSKLH